VPGVERQPLKKLAVDESPLLKLQDTLNLEAGLASQRARYHERSRLDDTLNDRAARMCKLVRKFVQS
jgi:hypothetical protein